MTPNKIIERSIATYILNLVGWIVQHWYNQMFVPQVVQSTNCLFGYGNLDSGLSQLLFGAIIYPTLKTYVFDGNMNLVWRTILIIPCAIASITGIAAARHVTEYLQAGAQTVALATAAMLDPGIADTLIPGR